MKICIISDKVINVENEETVSGLKMSNEWMDFDET